MRSISDPVLLIAVQRLAKTGAAKLVYMVDVCGPGWEPADGLNEAAGPAEGEIDPSDPWTGLCERSLENFVARPFREGLRAQDIIRDHAINTGEQLTLGGSAREISAQNFGFWGGRTSAGW